MLDGAVGIEGQPTVERNRVAKEKMRVTYESGIESKRGGDTRGKKTTTTEQRRIRHR